MELIGRKLQVGDLSYVIVDERNIDGEIMVYAEPTTQAAGPGKAAFRYVDIEAKLLGADPMCRLSPEVAA